MKDAIRDSLLRYAHLSIGEAGRRGCLVIAMITVLKETRAQHAQKLDLGGTVLSMLTLGALIVPLIALLLYAIGAFFLLFSNSADHAAH